MRGLYVRLPFTRFEAYAEYPSTLRGRTFMDTLRDPGALHLYVGRFYVVFGWPQKVPAKVA